MNLYDIEIREIRPFTRQVQANSVEEAVLKMKVQYGSRIHGEPKPLKVQSLQWHVHLSDNKATGWENDETQYDQVYGETFGPFDSKGEATTFAVKKAKDKGWSIKLEDTPWTDNLTWSDEYERGPNGPHFRRVDVQAKPTAELPMETVPAPLVIEPEFA